MINIQIKSIYGSILFEYENDINTTKKTLIEAVSKGAYLQGADLRGADLRGAYLRDAYLQGADLRGADLQGADLQDAYLPGADLRGAYLRGAYLRGADLRGANLDISKVKHLYQIFPEDGSFIAWKKLKDNCIAKLEIPSRSKKTPCFQSRKCRASYVKTLQIIDSKGNNIKEEVAKIMVFIKLVE